MIAGCDCQACEVQRTKARLSLAKKVAGGLLCAAVIGIALAFCFLPDTLPAAGYNLFDFR